MIPDKIKLVIVTLALSIAGCTEKDELTLPVTINLKIGIRKQEGSFGFNEGWIGVQRIQFGGKRESGGDVFFETDPSNNFPTLEFIEQYAKISSFEIPQGIYTNMKWDIFLNKIETDEVTDYNDTDSLNAGLVIKGDYFYDDWWWWIDQPPPENWVPSIPFVLIIDSIEQFSFMSYFPDPNCNGVLTENKEYQVILLFNLFYAFDSISPESFEKAEISGDSLNQKVIISRNKNKYLYEIILYRLATSSRVYVY
jgi:hypothetical protein